MDMKTTSIVEPAVSAKHSRPGRRAPRHVLPPLPYGYAALEPCIDAPTLTLHHDKHHAAYVEKLNAALEPYAKLHGRSALWLLLNSDAVPEAIRATVHNNASGHLNHSLFWRSMSPAGGDGLTGPLAAAIDQAFGCLEQFKIAFDEAGEKLSGAGWVWLVAVRDKRTGKPRLEIVTTSGHDNPIRQEKHPLLLNDVWEHAYCLKHKNRRPEYLKNWWQVVNWKEVTNRFEHPDELIKIEPADCLLAAATK
jgi:Fe-Mn family superoxide dismutase